MRISGLILKVAIVVAVCCTCASVNAGDAYQSCDRTTSEGGWANYAGGAECGSNFVGWGSNGTDRARISTYSAGVRRDMCLTYRHLFAKRANGDTSADHWAYSEGSYSANAPVNQQGSGNVEHTVALGRTSYNWDDWLEVGSDGGGSMDTVVEKGKFYPELDAVYAGRSVVASMYQGNVYQWMYQMSNPASAWWTWNTDGDRFARIGGVVSGPGWLSSNRVAKQPGTAPGGTWTLYFNVRPTQTGASNEDYQMIRENVSWFGDKPASNTSMRTAVTVTRKIPSGADGWDSGAKRKGETVRFNIYGADSWGTGDNYSWDFDGSTTQGWSAANNCTLTPEAGNGRLKIGITGGDPHLLSSGGLAINCSNANYVSIRMMASGGTSAQFFWSGSAGGWHEQRHVDFNIYPDNRWHIYTIKLPASWTGTVNQFRFDPVQNGVASGQTVYVDWIRIHNVNAGMSAKAWLGKADNNWNIWSDQAATWDETGTCWYKDYTIGDGYPQTYYHVMHVINNASQSCGEDPIRRYGQYQRAYKVLNTAPETANNSYPSNAWCITRTPALGWDYSDVDSNAQSRYQVQVSTTANFSNIIVDTDLVASASRSHITPALPEGQLYYRNRVMDGAYSNLSAAYQGGVSLNQNGALSGDSNSKSVDFNGADGYVSLPSVYDSFGGGFTCEFWAYPTAVNSWARFIDIGGGPGIDNIVLAREGTTNALRFYMYRGSENVGAVSAADAISLNTWQHFVATIDTSGWGRIYKNGSLIAQGPMAVPEVVSRPYAYIGKSNWAADSYYKGRIDEFAIYDRCLSGSEISDHYAKASQSASAYRDAVCAGGPWTYYRFDETSGSSASAYTGMLSDWSAGTGFRVDSISPTKPTITDVSINGNTATVSFGGSTDANNLSYEIKLDDGPFAAAVSPASLNQLTGAHVVYVRAIDEAGNISEAVSESFTMDSTPPSINSVTSPAATNTSPIEVMYSVTDSESGVKEVTLWVKKGSDGDWAATGLTSDSAADSFSYSVSSEDTYYFAVVAEDNAENITANPTGSGATNTIYDTTDPTASADLVPESQGDVNYLKGSITIEVEAADTDGSGIDKVEFKVDDGDYVEMVGSNEFYADDTTQITDSWTNGSHTITIKVTDNAGNYIEIQKDFHVNVNEVSGIIALHGLTLEPVNRAVKFVLTYTDNNIDHKITKTLTPTFINAKAPYSFTDLPDGIKSISAKTAWSLRKRLILSPVNGQCTANFTGLNHVPGGDLPTPGFPDGDNVVNALDYAILRGAWGYNIVGDISGDGVTDNNDYLAMLQNLYLKGDPE